MLKFRNDLYADVRIEDRFTTSIRYRNGMLEECKETQKKKAFLRVFDGNIWYYASTYKVDDLQGELDRLYESATPDPDISQNPVVSRFQANQDTKMLFENKCVKRVPLSEKQKFLEDRFPALAASDYVRMNVCAYSDRYSVFEFYSSKGASLKWDYQILGGIFVYALANETDNFSDMYQQSAFSFDELSCPKEEIEAAVKEAENFLLHAKPVEAGVYPVVLAPIVAGVFAHESFGHKSEADFMLGDETMKKEWALGTKVGADILSIYDSGMDFGSGYTPYDDEGTRATKTYLIKNGVLSGRLHSVSTAADLNEQPTGNARAISCDFEPIVRMTNTVIDAGDKNKEELFANIKHGYFIKDLKHGSGMSTFTIAPSLAYEIVDGKIGDPVKIAVITGNVFETLNLIDGLSDSVEIFSFVSGGCGKMEQYPLPVGFGGPYVSVSKMTVQ